MNTGGQQGLITLARTIATNQNQIQVFEYELKVVAVDDGGCCGGTTQLTSTGTVFINILTENIERPQFPGCSTYRPEVDENAVDAPVIQVGHLTFTTSQINSAENKLMIFFLLYLPHNSGEIL